MIGSRYRPLVVVLAAAAALVAGLGASADVGSGSGPPTAIGTGGAAASVEQIATRAAIDTLRRGGNAVDAAVATAAVLGVTEPFSAGIGGGGFMVIYRASDGKVTTIDHRETAPAAMTPTSFWENGVPLPFNDARYSGLSVGVPGTVEGWTEALEQYGTMTLAQVLAPAIHVARHGFVIDQTFFDQTNANRDFFDDVPATAALFLDSDGTPRDVGTVFTNPDLAATYSRIAHLGAKGFYRGAVADALVETVQHPPVTPTANHVWRPGVMTMRDLRDYVAPERAPTHVTYRGLDVYSMGPPSSGGSTVGEALNILKGYDLSSMTRADALHYYLEASRYSFADRNAFLADPAYFDVPLTGLLSKDYAETRRALITGTAATSPVPPGNPYPFNTGKAASTALQSETTTHLTTSDKWGNAVSYTYTIESTGGSGLVVPGFGFLLNNELTDFNFDLTTHPNRVEGGKRPRSSMSPTIVLKGRKPFLAVGSPGGSMIITTVLQILVDRLDLGLTLPQAIADPRASQRNTASTSAEPAFIASPEATALGARGHRFTSTAEIGAATGIEFLPGGRVLAAAEPVRRGGGSAMVESP
ncbi:MAG TPA: gamma-glutamyltransferase [Gaiellaceae bacterium]|jgi:gamma-glutamyltranspeptidase/glutathione hydrolase|nr:gamma-glutamyltransferase [Gaiellaceae bacterium]